MRPFLLRLLAKMPGGQALEPPHVSVAQRLAQLPVTGLPVSRPAEIRWNDHLIPWVTAETDEDLFTVLGLVQGHLRGAQILLLRHVAQGRLSELVGPYATEIDHALRILGFGRAAPQVVTGWPAQTRGVVQAFLRGLNHSLLRSPRPPEAKLLGLGREPVSEADLFAIGRLAGADINWLAYASLLPQRGRPGFADLWRRVRLAGGNPVGTRDEIEGRAALLAELLAGASRSGSNSVAVAAERSVTGAAMIASDPHLGLNLPNLWLIAGMRSPSYHLVGLMVPGLPVVALGRNRDVAWGGTNLRAASSDLFDVGGLPPGEIRTETTRIRRRFWFPAERAIRTSPLGPVLTDASLLPGRGGPPLALRWIGHTATDEITALLRAARATDGESFRAAFAGFGVSAQTMVWVDRTGRIGRFLAATLPDRTGLSEEDVVLDARDPAATSAWSRLRDATGLPAETDPGLGALASANDRPRWAEQPGVPPIGFFFSDDDRVLRLQELLAAKPRHTRESLAAIALDVRSPLARLVAARLNDRLNAMQGGHPAPELRGALAGWDGTYAAASRAPVAFECLLRHMLPALATERRRDGAATAEGADSQWSFVTTFLLPDLDALTAERRHAVLRRAALGAEADLRRLWTWGDVHRLRAAHWLAHLPVIGRCFVYGSFPSGGSRETPMKASHGLITGHVTPATFGSMARHVSDMSNPDANWFVLWGGQDGWLGSAAFMDQVPLWREGRAIRVPMRPEAVAAEFPRVTRIEPRR